MNSTDEAKIERMKSYLFSEITDAERNAFEQHFFEDSSAFYDLKDLENSLVDDYAAGKLAGKDLQRFEQALAKNPALREKISNAKVLRKFISAENDFAASGTIADVKIVSASESFSQKFSRFFEFSNSFLAPAIAALLLFFAVLSGFFFFKNQQLNEEIARLREANQSDISQTEANLKKQIEESTERENELKKNLEAQRGESETLTAQLEKEQTEKDRLKRQLENLQNQKEKIPAVPRNDQPTPAATRIDYASLLPTLVRGGDAANAAKTITVNSKTEKVVFNLQLPANSEEKSFTVSLDGQTLITNGKPRMSKDARKAIQVILNAKKLGDAIHTLSVGQTDYVFRLKFE